MKNPLRKSPLYLLTGLAMGLLSGLALAWLAFPAKTVDTAPSELRASYKEPYRVAIALAYASSGDLGRAQARLALLGDSDAARQLNSQAQLALLDQDSQREARALAQLARAIEAAQPSQVEVDPSLAPYPLAGAGYDIQEQQFLCEEGIRAPLLQLFIQDAEGLQQPEVALTLRSDLNEENGFTGLRPDFGPGYVEFHLLPGAQYELLIAEAPVLGSVQAVSCAGEPGAELWGNWLLTLRAR